jgi:voltage-gated potassium channel
MNSETSSSNIPNENMWINRITYELFIALVTLISLILVSLYYLAPLSVEVKEVLLITDSIISLVFLVDFFIRLSHRSQTQRYPLIYALLDLLSSVPGLPVLRYLRLPRLLVTIRLLRRHTPHEVRLEARQQLAQSTMLITALVALLVITVGSAFVVSFEAQAPDANIMTGEEAVWWSIVTVATVGYGDYVPVTQGGRIIGSIMMVVGVSIFSVLTSYISSLVINRKNENREELAGLRKEVAEIKTMLAAALVKPDEKTGMPPGGE